MTQSDIDAFVSTVKSAIDQRLAEFRKELEGAQFRQLVQVAKNAVRTDAEQIQSHLAARLDEMVKAIPVPVDGKDATPKQIAYARSLALRNQTLLPWEVQQDRRSLSAWIEAQAQLKPVSDMDRLPTSKQVAFAERLARIKRRAVPDECFRDKGLMSKWIDGNK
jgi:hypothetical protein